jgi:hypothetical protein
VRFPFRVHWNSTASYVGLLAASFALALFTSYILGPQINIYDYDSMFRAHTPAAIQAESVVVAIDELQHMQCAAPASAVPSRRRRIARPAEGSGHRRHSG